MDAAVSNEYSPEFLRLMAAIAFAIEHEDGATGPKFLTSDIVLVGQSRSSKSPTALYMARRYGMRVACVPFVLGIPLPSDLQKIEREKVVVLEISPERLKERRGKRIREFGDFHRPAGYAELDAIREEHRALRRLTGERGWQRVNVTGAGIEENATRIARLFGLRALAD